MRRVFTLTFVLLSILTIAFAGPAASLGAANQNVGYVDFGFGSAPGTDPTADKPQSKLWHHDGMWWAIMFHSSSSTWRIYKLSWPGQWVDTGTVVDTRPTSRADALWDGSKLYIASLIRLNSSNQGRFSRFSYEAGSQTYALDSGFPVTIMTGSAETMAMDKDSTGRFWISYTQSSKVYVNHSTDSSGATWASPFVLPGSPTIGADDISAIVAYNDQSGPSIGVLWSNHTSTSAPAAMQFALHRDSDAPGSWQPVETIYGGTGTCLADDHISLKSLQADPSGTLFAAVKTSVSDGSCSGGSDLIRLVVRKPDNTWQWTVFGSSSDQHTRPIVLLDTTNRKVYMFATAPTSCGVIYMKSTDMDNPSFPSGKGTPFVSSSTYTCINNVTSTKQTVSAATGLVVLASDESKKFYLHNAIELGAPPPDNTAPIVTSRAPAVGASDVAINSAVTATFSEAITGVNGASFTLTRAGGAGVAATVTYDSATKTATLTPSALLTPNTSYTAALTGAIADVAGNPLAALSWSFTTAPPDVTAPAVTSTSPAANATGVAMSTSVTATFSEAVSGVSAGSFTLSGPNGVVAATVSYDAASRTATLQPSTALAHSSSYTANLLSSITDTSGNPLAPTAWSFTTATPPAVTLINGDMELDTNSDGRPDTWTSNAKFTRSNEIAPHGGSYAGRFFATDNSSVTISQVVMNIVPGVSYNFTGWTNIPATADAFTLSYEVRWQNAGNSTVGTTVIKTYTAATNGWEQATQSLVAPANAAKAQVRMVAGSLNATLYVDDLAFGNTPPPADTTAPTVLGRVPAPGATGVLSNTGVTATFSEAVAGVSGATFKLSGPAGAVAATVSYSAATNTAMLVPSALLTPGATYTASLLAGIADGASNALVPLSWTFTVAPPPPPPGDTTAPTVTGRTPNNGALGIALNPIITASFSEAMNAATINGSTFTLTGPSGQVAATISYSAATRVATLILAAPLQPESLYIVSLTGTITDLAGNTLAVPNSWSFTTGTSSAPSHMVFVPLAAS